MHLSFDPISAAQLAPESRELIATTPTAALVVVAGPAATGPAVAATLAEQHPDHDVVLAATEKARWSNTELAEDVIDAARYAPDVHRHIVVADAHLATPTAHDILLKALEDASAGTTVWLTHHRDADLPAALRGRASRELTVLPANRADLAATLATQADVNEDTARDLLARADDNLTLAAAVAKFDLTTALDHYTRHRHTTTPTVTAHELTLALAHLAVAVHHKTRRAPVAPAAKKGSAPTADLTRLSPAAKATLRQLVDAVLARWERDIVTDLAAAASPQARQLCTNLSALAAIRRRAAFSTPVPTVLAAALVATNTPPDLDP